jgi:hypothetical protein
MASQKFMTAMQAVGKNPKQSLTDVEKFLPTAESLAAAILPPGAATSHQGVVAIDLIQKAVVKVRQQMAAAGVTSGSEAQELADVKQMTQAAVMQLLTEAGVTVDDGYMTEIVNAMVSILNVKLTSQPAA